MQTAQQQGHVLLDIMTDPGALLQSPFAAPSTVTQLRLKYAITRPELSCSR